MNKAKVLFVDDEPAVLEGVRHALRRYPFDIVTADSGALGLALLAHASIDVVVSDERMPEMPGSEFLAQVCRLYPETIRIILTGQATLDAAIRAVNEGEIFRFLLKPCNPVDLGQTIVNALQVRDLRLQATRLLVQVRRRGSMLEAMEREHPGITAVTRSRSGTIEITAADTQDLDTLLAEIRRELDPPAATPATGEGTARAA